jgi:hypothetical protein
LRAGASRTPLSCAAEVTIRRADHPTPVRHRPPSEDVVSRITERLRPVAHVSRAVLLLFAVLMGVLVAPGRAEATI